MACNGSRLLTGVEPVRDAVNTTRDEGTAVHWAAVAVCKGEYSDIFELVDRKAPNGTYITLEMAEHVQEYIDTLHSRGTSVWSAEMECDTSHDGPGYVIAGRADFIRLITPDISVPGVLHVDDFKYGWRIVEPEMNWTLISHAIGWCLGAALNKTLPPVPAEIVFTIHQPRPFHREGKTRQWRISYAELFKLYEQLKATLSNPSDLLVTGPQCRKCDKIINCVAARSAEMNAIDVAETGAFDLNISDDALSFHLDNIARAKAILDGSEKAFADLAMQRLKQGKIVKNYSVDSAYGNRRWKENITPEMVKMITTVDVSKPAMITPTQAMKKGISETVMNTLSERPSTGIKLVRESATAKAKRLLK